MQFELFYTPHHTCRLWLYKNGLIINPTLKLVLDALSVWGGADKEDNYCISWEFEYNDYVAILRMASRLWKEIDNVA